MNTEFWQDLLIILLTLAVIAVIVFFVFGYACFKDMQKGQLRIGVIIKYFVRKIV
ncbi:MAG TPA: hypothetical protein VEX64_07795 [Pyrinomonadaceae bacterium]|jgi:hypothetical protein|nr:hypothetical protein [Pyrinomonadaceae bacterium]